MLSSIHINFTTLSTLIGEFFDKAFEEEFERYVEDASLRALHTIGSLWKNRAQQYAPVSSGDTEKSLKYVIDLSEKTVTVVYTTQAGFYADKVAGWARMGRLVRRKGNLVSYGIGEKSQAKQNALNLPGLGVGGNFIYRAFLEIEPKIEDIVASEVIRW